MNLSCCLCPTPECFRLLDDVEHDIVVNPSEVELLTDEYDLDSII